LERPDQAPQKDLVLIDLRFKVDLTLVGADAHDIVYPRGISHMEFIQSCAGISETGFDYAFGGVLPLSLIGLRFIVSSAFEFLEGFELVLERS
jgi:hypothetical protein